MTVYDTIMDVMALEEKSDENYRYGNMRKMSFLFGDQQMIAKPISIKIRGRVMIMIKKKVNYILIN